MKFEEGLLLFVVMVGGFLLGVIMQNLGSDHFARDYCERMGMDGLERSDAGMYGSYIVCYTEQGHNTRTYSQHNLVAGYVLKVER